MALWLKMIGTCDDPWSKIKSYDSKTIGFRGRKPTGVHPGDRMILYAVHWKRIFAVADVTSDWKYNDECVGWPYHVDILWPLKVNLPPSVGVDASEVSANLMDRVKRRSHIRLSPEEFKLAEAKLREASSRVETSTIERHAEHPLMRFDAALRADRPV